MGNIVKMDTDLNSLEKYYDEDMLPDGQRFQYWDCKTDFAKTLYVDQKHPNASDEGDGSPEHPFLTISKAASIVKPGERVLIREGRYFETIRTVMGGTDPKHMVLFEGEKGTVITGGIEWRPEFRPSEGYRQTPVVLEYDLFHTDISTCYSDSEAKVWMGDLPRDGSLYEYGYNPFLIMNLHTLSWVPRRNSYPRILEVENTEHLDRDEHLKKRGLVFADGRRLQQVVRYFELFEKEDVFWVDETYKRLHFHLKDNASPFDCKFEITIREQGFMPDRAGLGYIYFKNIIFEKFANPIKCPQYGALSSNCGHHFIIENCVFTDINSVGLDLGFIGHNHMHEGIRGHHIVRNNRFERCGISGMAAVPTMGFYLENMLVENNVLIENGFHDMELLYESAAIKSHFTRNSLYRNNFIFKMRGSGIWLDNHNCNTRVTGNIIMHIEECSHGALFNEATLDTVMFDHNFVCDVKCFTDCKGETSGGNGIYEHHSENTVVWENICMDIEADGVHFKYTPNEENQRFLCDNKRTGLMRNNVAVGNLIMNCRYGVSLSTPKDRSNANSIQGAKGTQCFISSNGEKHNRESFCDCYGFESDDNIVVKMEYDEGVFIVQTDQNREYRFTPQNGASVMAFFKNVKGKVRQ